jgi:uncharacterized protein YaeQ
MAIKSTVFKAQLTVSDLNRNYYADHALVLARHPSETDLRMMLRVVAFALNAHERLQFAKGLADADEPDLWQMDLTGQIEHWIELGHPTEKRLRQSCGKSRQVSVYSYQRGGAALWFDTIKDTAARFEHLKIFHFGVPDEAAFAPFVDRSMTLNCMIEDDQVLLSNDAGSLTVVTDALKF